MEFLRLARRRSTVSELVYILLNVGLAVAILLVVWVVESPLPAFALVLLSKWRILAVRPRYWLAHIQANMVDLIVSVSFVILLYAAGHAPLDRAMIVQIVLMVLYAAWLLLLKPRAKRSYVVAQAGMALFVGTVALYGLAYSWPSSLVVIVMFIIGYSSARHVLSAYSDSEVTFMSLIWGFVIAQMGWLAFHWTIAYSVPLVDGIKLPQIAVIILGLSFLAERIYASYDRHGVVRGGDIILPAFLSLGLIAVVLVLFNAVNMGNI